MGKLLSSLKIHYKFQISRITNINSEIHAQWELRIPASEFEKIEKNMIIPHSLKQEKLSLLIFSRRKRMEGERAIALKKLIVICRKLKQKGIKRFTVRDILEHSNFKRRILYKYIKLAQEKSILKTVGGKGIPSDPFLFEISGYD